MRADLSSVTFQDRAVYEVFQGSVLQEVFPPAQHIPGCVCHLSVLAPGRPGEEKAWGRCYRWLRLPEGSGEEEEGEKKSGARLWYAAKGQEFMAVN